MSRHPEVLWAERADKVYLTVVLPDAKKASVTLHPDSIIVSVFTLPESADQECYKLELFANVDVNESKSHLGDRKILCVLVKAEKKWWKKLLRGDGKTPQYVKVDWDKWAEEDDDEAPADINTRGMEFSSFGGVAGSGSGSGSFQNSDDGVVHKLANLAVGSSAHPEVLWSERESKVYLAVTCANAKDVKVNLNTEGVLTLSGFGGAESNCDDLKLELADRVNVEESKVNVGEERIFVVLTKAEKLWWNKLLQGDGDSPDYIKMDFDKWITKFHKEIIFDRMVFTKFGATSGEAVDMSGLDFPPLRDLTSSGFHLADFERQLDGRYKARYLYRKPAEE